MSELAFVFEPAVTGTSGRIYLDDIYIEGRSGGAPTPSPLCFSTPAPTSTGTPLSTQAGTTSPTATPTPGNSPTPGGPVLIADFDSCDDQGQRMGASAEFPDVLADSYLPESGRGCVVKLEFMVDFWASFWIKLNNLDMTQFSQLVFDVRGDPVLGIPEEVKVELSRLKGEEVSILYFDGIDEDWQTITLYLEDFEPDDLSDGLSDFTEMELLLFTFDIDYGGPEGAIYLDNIDYYTRC